MEENHEALRHAIAGLLSTIDFTPSREHPEKMFSWADQVFDLIQPSSTFNDERRKELTEALSNLCDAFRQVYEDNYKPALASENGVYHHARTLLYFSNEADFQ
jgi:hypothetical protein